MPCFSESDVKELGRAFLADHDRRLLTIPEDLCVPFHDEARQLEMELLLIYKATVLCVRREESMDVVSARWEEMVGICDESITRLRKLADKHTLCGADIYYDRVVELIIKCIRPRMR